MMINTDPFRTKRYFFDLKTGQLYNSINEIKRKKEINEEGVLFLLGIGYIPGNLTLFKDVICLPGGCKIKIDEKNWSIENETIYSKNYSVGIQSNDALMKEAKQLLLQIIDEHIKKTNDFLIPLSGGWDSRAILAATLEIVETKKIETFTFGTEKSYDFEIGQMVAKKNGVRNFVFDLDKIEITENDLYNVAVFTDANTDIFQPVFTYKIMEYLGKGVEYWTGFMGDPLAGSHIPKSPNNMVDEAKKSFIAKEFKDLTDINILKNHIDVVQFRNTFNFNLHLEEILDFNNRQERYVGHHLFFSNFRYFNPFIDVRWIEFMLSLPYSLRNNQKFYHTFLNTEFPQIFSIPTKDYYSNRIYNKLQSRLHKAFPGIFSFNKTNNYIDYNKSIKNGGCLENIIKNINAKSIELLKNYLGKNNRNILEKYNINKNMGEKTTLLTSLNFFRKIWF